MPHLVGRQLGNMERIADPIKNIFDCPLREGLARVAVRVRQKYGTVRLSSVVLDEGSTIFLKIRFKPRPSGMGEDNDPRHVVLRDFGTDSDGMRPPVDIVDT